MNLPQPGKGKLLVIDILKKLKVAQNGLMPKGQKGGFVLDIWVKFDDPQNKERGGTFVKGALIFVVAKE